MDIETEVITTLKNLNKPVTPLTVVIDMNRRLWVPGNKGTRFTAKEVHEWLRENSGKPGDLVTFDYDPYEFRKYYLDPSVSS